MLTSTSTCAATQNVSRMRVPIRLTVGWYSMARAVTKAADNHVVRHSMRASSLLADASASGAQASRSYQLNEFGVVTSHDAYRIAAARIASEVGSFAGSTMWSPMPGSARMSISLCSIHAITAQPAIATTLMMIFETFQLYDFESSPNTGPAQAPAFTYVVLRAAEISAVGCHRP